MASTVEMADDQDAGAAGEILQTRKGEKQMDSKKWWASGTFWGALGGAIASIANGVAAFKAGDTAKVGESIMATIGFWTAWRLRKGQGVAIAAPVE